MAATILYVRHADKKSGEEAGPNPSLTRKGIEQAKELGRNLVANGYEVDVVRGSNLVRTTETGVIAISETYTAADVMEPDVGVFTKRFDEWKATLPSKDVKLEEGETVAGYVKRTAGQFYSEEARRSADVIRRIAEVTPGDQTVLVAGHSPLIEVVVAELAEEDPNNIPALKDCEGWELVFDETGFVSAKTLPWNSQQ